MKRLAYVGLAPMLLTLAACNSGTFVVLDFTGGPADATSIACTLSLAGKSASATFSDKGKALSFPLEGSLQIESGAGSMSVACDAKAASGVVGSVSGTVTVVRDKTEKLTLAFQSTGPDMGTDGATPPDLFGRDLAGEDMTVVPPMLTSSPLAHDYGTVTTTATPPVFAFTITNGGTTATQALTVSVDNAQFIVQSGDTCTGTQLAPAATCSVSVAYKPASATATVGTLTVTYPGLPGADAATASLTGTGAIAGSLKWSVASADFGTALVGGNGMSKTFTLTNQSTTDPTSAVTISLTGTDIGAFSITDNECNGVSLAASGTCTVTVQFTPDMAGNVAPSLQATATTGGTDTVVLMGNGQAPATLVLSPTTSMAAPHDYGIVDIMHTSGKFTVTVSNTGDVPTGTLSYTPTGLTVTGDGMCAASGTVSLAAHGSCTVVLTATPTVYGAGQKGSVSFTASPGGNVTAYTTLTGQDYVTVMVAHNAGALGQDGVVTDGAPPVSFDCGPGAGETTCGPVVFPRTADLTITLTATASSGSFVSWSPTNGAPSCATSNTTNPCVATFGTSFVGAATSTAVMPPPTYTANFGGL